MTTTCLISNYNYARFLGDALGSVLQQTQPFDQIIVVDDGSTDGSLALLRENFARHSEIEIVAKTNQGQLSCFNEGFARATGDVIFFLDADDVYEPQYVEQVMEVYNREPSHDFVFCGHRQFGERESLQMNFPEDRDLGYSVILSAYLHDWIGAPTSCLSMRRRVLEKILPLPFIDDWRTRADDCLVFGASLAGARKYFLAQPLVRYRVHNTNQFFGRGSDKYATYRRRVAVNALFEYLERKLSYDVVRLAEFHHREFCTIARPTFRQLTKYCRIGLGSQASLLRRMSCLAEITAHFLRTAMRPVPSTAHASAPAQHQPTRPLQVFVPAADPIAPPEVESAPQRRRLAA